MGRLGSTKLSVLLVSAVWACGGTGKPSAPASPADLGDKTDDGLERAKSSESPKPSESSQSEQIPEVLARLRAIADVTAVVPGQSFTVAAVLDIEPGWHIYWINPGESGLRTELHISAPEGYEVGEARFPGPVRFGDKDNTSYGYAGRVVISVPVKAPASAVLGTDVEVNVQGEWLACKFACIQGKGSAVLSLPVAATSSPANSPVFREHSARLPKAIAPPFKLQHVWTDAGAKVSISIDGAATQEYFPHRDLQLSFAGQASTSDALELTFRKPPLRVRGVVRGAASDGTIRYFNIDIHNSN